MPCTFTSCAVSGTNSARVESSAARWKTTAISNSRMEAIEQVTVEDVAHAHRRAPPGHGRIQRPDVEGEDVERPALGDLMDQTVADLTAGA